MGKIDESLVSKKLVAEVEVLPREQLVQRLALTNGFAAILLGAMSFATMIIGLIIFVFDMTMFWKSKKREKAIRQKYNL